jgi:hypothetical protein
MSSAVRDGAKVFVVDSGDTPCGHYSTESPFIGGARPGVDDFSSMLARFAFISGAQKWEEGVSALEKMFGPRPGKVKAAWVGRDGWRLTPTARYNKEFL